MGISNTKTTQRGSRATQKLKVMHDYHCNVILRDDYINKRGTSTLALQAFINNKRKVIRVGLEVRPGEFDAKAGRVRIPGNKQKESDYNLILANAEAKANAIFTNFRLRERVLTVDEYRKQYLTADLRINFLAYARNVSAGQKGVIGKTTHAHQELALRYLEEFKSPFMMYDVNYENIRLFDEFLRKTVSRRTKKKIADNHIWKMHSKIRKFIVNAINEGIEIDNPYKKFKVKKKPGVREFLVREEVEKLIDIWQQNILPFTQQQCLAAYLFSCTCGGFRLSDLEIFDDNNINAGNISFTPYKTRKFKNKIITLQLPDIGIELIKHAKGKLFHLPSQQKFNIYIKSIAFMAGIKKDISAHTARHTFATQYLEAGGNVTTLQHILGHSNINETMIYVHIIDKTITRSMSIMNVFQICKPEAHPQTLQASQEAHQS